MCIVNEKVLKVWYYNWLGDTPLHWAARYGCQGIVEILIKNNASMDEKNDDGNNII